jgi:hypothetical protein
MLLNVFILLTFMVVGGIVALVFIFYVQHYYRNHKHTT